MKYLKAFAFIFIFIVLFGCASSIKDIKEMEPFLKTKIGKADKNIEDKEKFLFKINNNLFS